MIVQIAIVQEAPEEEEAAEAAAGEEPEVIGKEDKPEGEGDSE